MSRDSHKNTDTNRIFFQLYGNCQNRIFGFLLMMVHNENDAEELLQETAAAMWEKFDNFEQGTNFTAWAITIARHKAINFLRKKTRLRPLLSDDIYKRISELEAKEEEDNSDRASALKKCMKTLKDSDQKLLQMRYEYEMSMSNIAELFGRSKIGIYQTLARIHNLLYLCIKKTMKARSL